MRQAEDIRQALPIEAVAANPDHVLDLRKVCKQFGTDPAVDALIDVDLVLRRGEWLSITSPSGSGKSTLLNILGCLDRPTRGKYLLDGIETTTLSENERAGLRSRRIGFIFQSFHLLPYRTVLENVMLAEVYRRQTGRGRRERAMEEIRRVGLAHRADFPPSKLSGGECQRVAIARALMGSPSLLLCDEPTRALPRTAGNRIISQFDQLAATELFISARPGLATGTIDPRAIPWDAPERLARLNGVVAAGLLSDVNVHDTLVSASPVVDPVNQTAFKLAVRAASPDLFRAVRAELASGRFLDSGHSARADRVAILGADAARRLGISGVERLPAIYVGDQLYLVIGILRDVVRKPELLGSVVIPEGTARRHFSLLGPSTVVVETKIGAASLIALQARAALRPDDPRALRVQLPQEPRRVRDDVQTDLNVMFLLLGGLSLMVGALGIANITLVGVMERTAEIGLRRAIGATRRHIAAQFLIESASMGVVGGLLGSSVGVLIVVGVSAYQVWTPVLDPLAPLLAPAVAGGIGLLSGVYPASRAAALEPAEAFRH